MSNQQGIGVAVIGAGMAGRAHAAGYRAAPTVYGDTLPPIRLVTIADVYEPAAATASARYGFERHDTSWQAVAAADDVDVVSVVVANVMHREIVEALLRAGKNVLCEKPLSDTLEDARAMVAAADAVDAVAGVGLTFRRSPGFAAVRRLVQSGRLGRVVGFSGTYWADYGLDPRTPMSWRFRGPAGSGALADVGSHLSYLAEFVVGADIAAVRGGTFGTVVTERPKPLGAVSGRGHVEVSDELAEVENDDLAAFTAEFDGGAIGTLQVSRVAAGHPNTLTVEVQGERGAASFDFRHPGEMGVFLLDDDAANAGWRTVTLGPEHPYWLGGLAMDAPGVGIGQNEGFVFQARAFLDEVAGVPEPDALPRVASFREGLHNMQIIAAVAESAAAGGARVEIP
jgi:predicted dehydrogenase